MSAVNAQVVVVVVVVGCVQYSWSQVSAFSCYQKPPSDTECQQLHNSVKTNLRTCAIISEFILGNFVIKKIIRISKHYVMNMMKFLSYYFNNTSIIHVNIHTNLHIYMFKQTAGCREEVGWGHWLSPPRSFCLKILGNLACLHNKLFGNRIIKFAPNMHLGILSAQRKWVSLTSAFKIISTGNSRNTFNVAIAYWSRMTEGCCMFQHALVPNAVPYNIGFFFKKLCFIKRLLYCLLVRVY